MCLLALLKLQDIESFSTMFLNYDLLADIGTTRVTPVVHSSGALDC